MHHDHPLVDKGSTLVEVLSVCDLLLQPSTEYPQYLTHLDIVRADAHVIVLKLCTRVCACVCVCVGVCVCVCV